MQCIKCGEEIPGGSKFCNHCGARQEKPTRAVKHRGNGTGTVYKDGGKGGWIAEVTLGYYVKDGKRRRKSARKYGFKTKKDAVNYLAALQQGHEVKDKHIAFSALWETFSTQTLDALSKSKQTAYRIAWRKIEADVGYHWVTDLNVSDLQEITDRHGNSYYTKRDIKNLLSHLYKLAIQDDYTDRNRAQFIKLPTLETQEREVMSEKEIRLLWEDYHYAPSAVTAQRLTMLYTGIRPGELLQIKKENVHLEAHYMTGGIKTNKGKKRKIILPDKLLPVLTWMIDDSSGALITDYQGKKDFYDAWAKKRKELEIRECITPYCCRHTYITRLTALKVSPAMLQELAGHEDYDTTLEYTHLSVEERLKEVNRMD